MVTIYSSSAERAGAQALSPYERVLESLLREAADTLADPETVWYLASQQTDETIQRQIGLSIRCGLERYAKLRHALMGSAIKALYEDSVADADNADPDEGKPILTDRQWIELGEEIERRIKAGRF